MNMHIICNKGQAIASTNFWNSDYASEGLTYLSWNAGAGRLLLPDCQKPMLREMRSAKYVIVSHGPWSEQGGREALELLFEDGTDAPFCIHMSAEQCDRQMPVTEQGGGFYIAVWTRGGMKLRLPGKYREVNHIPYLKTWSEH